MGSLSVQISRVSSNEFAIFCGSTPTHTFTIPFDTSLLAKVEILYAQNDVVIVKKTEEDCTFDGRDIVTTLSQEETLKFSYPKEAQIQVRVLTKDGKAIPSIVERVKVHKYLGNEVLK